MRLRIYADDGAYDWHALMAAHGHAVSVAPLGLPCAYAPVDACVVLALSPADLLSARFWLPTLPAPTLLITTAPLAAQSLGRRAPALRLVCHPSRAVHQLADLLARTCEVCAGTLALGPIPPRMLGGRHALA